MIPMSDNPGGYFILEDKTRVRLPVGKCRFIASAAPVENEEEARQFIQIVREEFPDATHHVFAYRLGEGDGALERSSDDREPAGSGGPPVLSAIQKAGVSDVAMVVSRYFGGVKLGVGGLIRAYRSAAEECLQKVPLISREYRENLTAKVPYEDVGAVLKAVSSFRGEIKNIDYGSEVTVECLLRPTEVENFSHFVHDATRGKGKIEILRP